MQQKLAEMRLQVRDDIPEEVLNVHADVKNLRAQINQLDAQRLSLSEQIGLLTSEIEKLQLEKAKYVEILKEWRAYELFMNAVSKKGIPLRIMSAQLPAINAEISKILQGVVGFTVELEADPSSNDMDIFINYGDSRRIIECASGMEKMVSSLAIRVALINISSLPKTDLLIIDEGFGALDEMNVEACNRLLESLKKWFKNILVISHVDAVKDAVDNTIEIMRRNKDAQVQIE
jgi:exonuclease SbcC